MIKVQIMGRLGVDPEERFTADGKKIVNLRVATNIRKKGQEETIWWKVVIFGDKFSWILPHLKKGSAVIISGSMNKPDIYNNREGQPQVGLEIIAEVIDFSPFGKSQQTDEASQPNAGYAQPQTTSGQYTQQQDEPSYANASVEEDPMPF